MERFEEPIKVSPKEGEEQVASENLSNEITKLIEETIEMTPELNAPTFQKIKEDEESSESDCLGEMLLKNNEETK